MYRTTPHTTTGTFLAQMLFHHITNNGLPTIQPNKSTVSNWETNYRERNKEYIDKKQFTKHKDFQIGEKVLVKRPKTKSKMDSFYEQHPYTITENYNNSVRIKDTKGKVHIRNKAHVKQYFQKPIYISSTTHGIIEINHNVIWEMISSYIHQRTIWNQQYRFRWNWVNSIWWNYTLMLDSDQESSCNDDFSAGTTDSVDQPRSYIPLNLAEQQKCQST